MVLIIIIIIIIIINRFMPVQQIFLYTWGRNITARGVQISSYGIHAVAAGFTLAAPLRKDKREISCNGPVSPSYAETPIGTEHVGTGIRIVSFDLSFTHQFYTSKSPTGIH
jgi:hypothetical protein